MRKVPRWLVRCAPHQAIGSLIPPDVCFGAGCRPQDPISPRLPLTATEGPRVRIRLPPAESPSLIRLRLPSSRSRGFSAGIRAGTGGTVGRDPQGPANVRSTGGNISVGPYSSTAVPPMRFAAVPALDRKRGQVASGRSDIGESFECAAAQAKPSTVRWSCQPSGKRESAGHSRRRLSMGGATRDPLRRRLVSERRERRSRGIPASIP